MKKHPPQLRLLNLDNNDEVAFMFETRRHPQVDAQLLGAAPSTMEQHREWLKKNHRNSRNIYLICSDIPVGYCQMLFMPDHEMELGWVVHPDFQSQGYGRYAVGALIQEAQNNGAKKLCLYVKKENSKALKLYESFGFRPQVTENSDVILMRLAPLT